VTINVFEVTRRTAAVCPMSHTATNQRLRCTKTVR